MSISVSAVSESTHAKRNQTIEALRIAAAFGVVVFHSGSPFRHVAYFGLIIFVMMSAMWAVKKSAPFAQAMRGSALKILPAWLVWFSMFGALNVAFGAAFLRIDDGHLVLAILRGTSLHLWYLPFIVICMALIYAIPRPYPKWVSIGSGAAGAGMIALASFWLPVSAAMISPLPQYAHAAAAVLIGVAMGGGQARTAAIMALAGMLVAALTGEVYMATTYALAVVVLTATILAPDFLRNWNIQRLSSTAFGVYVLHPIPLYHIAPRIGLSGTLSAVFAFVVSIMIVLVVARLTPAVARRVFLA